MKPNPWIVALRKCAKKYQLKKRKKIEKKLFKISVRGTNSKMIRLRNKY